MKKKLAIILSLILLSGCSSIAIKDSSVKKRDFKLSVLGGIVSISSVTDDLVIGEANIDKESEDD